MKLCISLTWLLSVVNIISRYTAVDCNGVSGLPSSGSIQSLTTQYQHSLLLRYSEERFFPALQFPFDGEIIGWKFAATDNRGGASPVVTPWSFNSDTGQYMEGTEMKLSECVTSEIELDDVTVFIHESGPPTPIPFNRGDILSLFMRPQDVADFVPYLYDGNLQSEANGTSGPDGNFSYYRMQRAPQGGPVRLESLRFRDDLLPLMSLELCSTESQAIADIERCNGTTMQRSLEDCMRLIMDNTTTLPTTTEGTTTTTTTTTTMTTASTATVIADSLLVIAIAVPVVLLIITLVILVLVLACCLYRKRKHSTYTTDITLETFRNGSASSATVAHSYKPTSPVEYDSSDPTFVVSGVSGEQVQNGHKCEPVGNYEEPMTLFSGSGDLVRNHMYDTPNHSREPSADRASYSSVNHSPFQLPGATMRQYHTLERPDQISTPPLLRRNQSPHVSPNGSPHQPRLRLRSSDALTFQRVGSGPPQSRNMESPASDRFFRLETGAYVPTEDQRNSIAIKNMFDDTSYATFNRATINSPIANNWVFFEECESYWKPSAESKLLYEQLSSQKYREINRKQIEIKDHLGSGEFGTVCGGEWHTEQGDLDIAIKMLTGQSSERDTVRFLQEAAIIGQFKHPNIVRLHGVVTVGAPVMIILELVKNGDLRKYLRAIRPVPGEDIPQDLPQRLLDFCSQIALGMDYLSRKEFIHRDLAARNILLTEDYICKIADFGMSRDLDDDDYYISNGGKVPIKWTAPEALHFRKYSTATDVWSFGVLMYEVWSMGKTPYRDQSPEQTISLVQSGCRLAPPPGCPRAIYQIMINSWHSEADYRPSFAKLINALSQPTSALLYWVPEDSNLHPHASKLGAPLEAAAELHSDLQKTYMYASADLED